MFSPENWLLELESMIHILNWWQIRSNFQGLLPCYSTKIPRKKTDRKQSFSPSFWRGPTRWFLGLGLPVIHGKSCHSWVFSATTPPGRYVLDGFEHERSELWEGDGWGIFTQPHFPLWQCGHLWPNVDELSIRSAYLGIFYKVGTSYNML